jgi:hypothetical protein
MVGEVRVRVSWVGGLDEVVVCECFSEVGW